MLMNLDISESIYVFMSINKDMFENEIDGEKIFRHHKWP